MTTISTIHWTHPWQASIQAAAQRIVVHADWRAALNECSAASRLNNHRDLPIVFVEQAALPDGMAYEAFISATGQVPTRDNLHDFFNALVWLSFPCIKRQLNALQAAQIAVSGIGQARGATRDAATVFDENAALLVVRDGVAGQALIDALRNHRWQQAFVEQRVDFHHHIEVWLFGHALMEKLVMPYKGITAHAYVVVAPDEFFMKAPEAKREWLDTRVASELSSSEPVGLSTARFTPLPVLGIPGWWPAQDAAFYDDATVFRPMKSNKTPRQAGRRTQHLKCR